MNLQPVKAQHCIRALVQLQTRMVIMMLRWLKSCQSNVTLQQKGWWFDSWALVALFASPLSVIGSLNVLQLYEQVKVAQNS